MSGHNKWSKIKNRKAVTDARKSKIFTKMVRLLRVEAKKAKGNVDSPGLRTAIEKAKSVNVPNENIERAVKKATDASSGEMEAVIYEAYGPGGVAVIIEGLTDNRNKAAAEVKYILSRHGSALAAIGSASWAFEKQERVGCRKQPRRYPKKILENWKRSRKNLKIMTRCRRCLLMPNKDIGSSCLAS